MTDDLPSHEAESAPSLPLLHAIFLLAGYGTLLLGPILPLLASAWSLSDSQAGLLLFAQFLGATLGGITVSRHLTRDLLQGLSAAAIGFGIFTLPAGFAFHCTLLFLGGFGIGRVIATTNILAGRRATAHRGSLLARLNTTWSLGALLSPILAALLVPHTRLLWLLLAFAAALIACALTLQRQLRRIPIFNAETTPPATPAPTPVFLFFCLLLLLYGGLETCLAGWLTTFAHRYAQTSLILSAFTLALLLAGLTLGRALAARLLLHLREATLLRIALALSIALTAALALTRSAPLMAIAAVLLGITLAPIFPATFALFMATQPHPRQAGIVLAASGIGAAILPALMGLVSTHTHSLQLALTLPIAAATLLLVCAFLPCPIHRQPHRR